MLTPCLGDCFEFYLEWFSAEAIKVFSYCVQFFCCESKALLAAQFFKFGIIQSIESHILTLQFPPAAATQPGKRKWADNNFMNGFARKSFPRNLCNLF